MRVPDEIAGEPAPDHGSSEDLDRVEHESKLADSPLLAMPLRSLREAQRAEDRRVAEWARESFARGAVVEPPEPPRDLRGPTAEESF